MERERERGMNGRIEIPKRRRASCFQGVLIAELEFKSVEERTAEMVPALLGRFRVGDG